MKSPDAPRDVTRPADGRWRPLAPAIGIVVGAAIGVLLGSLFWDISWTIVISVALGLIAGAAVVALRR
jgi:hypothetical protein